MITYDVEMAEVHGGESTQVVTVDDIEIVDYTHSGRRILVDGNAIVNKDNIALL